MRGRKPKKKDSLTPPPEEVAPPAPEPEPTPPLVEETETSVPESVFTEADKIWEMEFVPMDGGNVRVKIKQAGHTFQSMVTRANIMAEGEKVGLGPPTPQTPVAKDRHTS